MEHPLRDWIVSYSLPPINSCQTNENSLSMNTEIFEAGICPCSFFKSSQKKKCDRYRNYIRFKNQKGWTENQETVKKVNQNVNNFSSCLNLHYYLKCAEGLLGKEWCHETNPDGTLRTAPACFPKGIATTSHGWPLPFWDTGNAFYTCIFSFSQRVWLH